MDSTGLAAACSVAIGVLAGQHVQGWPLTFSAGSLITMRARACTNMGKSVRQRQISRARRTLAAVASMEHGKRVPEHTDVLLCAALADLRNNAALHYRLSVTQQQPRSIQLTFADPSGPE
jgi:hypothetical protein